MNVKVQTLNKEEASGVRGNKDVWEAEYNPSVIQKYVRVYLHNARKFTAKTKHRGEVRGGEHKPWSQKHTGRARQGSIRSPIWVGGATVHGPKGVKVMMKMNKKEKVAFYKVVLSELLREDMIRVVSSDSLKELDENLIKKKKGLTKKALKELGELIDGDTEMLLEGGYEGVKMGLKNVENVCVKNLGNIDWFDIIRADRVILTDEVFRELNKRYS